MKEAATTEAATTEPGAYDAAARLHQSPPEASAQAWSPPEQSRDDTDRGWGEVEPGDDADLARLTREKPPHYSD